MLVKYDGVKDGKQQMIQITDHFSDSMLEVEKAIASFKNQYDYDAIRAYEVEWVDNNDSMRFEYQVISRLA
ncbi:MULTISPECIES: hypothetical protein [Bacillus cereus group]|uniref:hypothetical protein n=1 Tax=Bacillus cereus group TaxID=86661 RepID=UPI001F1869C0|nr:hypothetical protein [Bacillus cereus]MCE7035042.1 hypothetical protein [Bacillus cereus]